MPQITELVLGRCLKVSSVQSLSCVRLFATPCSTPGFPVHQQLPEFTQTYIHSVHDAIQPSHPLSTPSSSAFNLFQASRPFLMSQLFSSHVQSFGKALKLIIRQKENYPRRKSDTAVRAKSSKECLKQKGKGNEKCKEIEKK